MGNEQVTGAGEGSWVVMEKVGRRGAEGNLGSKCCLQNEISHDVLKFQPRNTRVRRRTSSDQTAIAGL